MAAPILMVDARNCMYRACYASQAERERQLASGMRTTPQKHPLIIMLRLIGSWIRTYKPRQVQVFWDAPRETVWRRAIMPTYKDRDDSEHVLKLKDDLVRTQRAAMECFNHLKVVQFYKNKMEADDLIYAACKIQCHLPIVIFSSDSDMLQIPYAFQNVRIFNPDKRAEVPSPNYNLALQKALMGDTSDKIPGYYGLGPKKSAVLLDDFTKLESYLCEHGRGTYLRNLLLIDLGVCPYVLKNQIYVTKVLATPPRFDRDQLFAAQQEHRVTGMLNELAEEIALFSRIGTHD